ncbi:hypothetical protein [Nakamurella lactea]|uniref:hypothetical protein n=1 Tax=Nakamurella lactea TaxID=459515 RepID=UPI001377B54F|nr:hypothetical protein [Nakamurella lactea]
MPYVHCGTIDAAPVTTGAEPSSPGGGPALACAFGTTTNAPATRAAATARHALVIVFVTMYLSLETSG